MHELFWMLQCNCTVCNCGSLSKIVPLSNRVLLWVKTLKVIKQQLKVWNDVAHAESICTFLCLTLFQACKSHKLLLTADRIPTHESLLQRKAWQFSTQFPNINLLNEKCFDFHLCGWWLHHCNSRGFHVSFYLMKQLRVFNTLNDLILEVSK